MCELCFIGPSGGEDRDCRHSATSMFFARDLVEAAILHSKRGRPNGGAGLADDEDEAGEDEDGT